MAKTYKRYTQKQRDAALAYASKHTLLAASKRFNVPMGTLSNWRYDANRMAKVTIPTDKATVTKQINQMVHATAPHAGFLKEAHDEMTKLNHRRDALQAVINAFS